VEAYRGRFWLGDELFPLSCCRSGDSTAAVRCVASTRGFDSLWRLTAEGLVASARSLVSLWRLTAEGLVANGRVGGFSTGRSFAVEAFRGRSLFALRSMTFRSSMTGGDDWRCGCDESCCGRHDAGCGEAAIAVTMTGFALFTRCFGLALSTACRCRSLGSSLSLVAAARRLGLVLPLVVLLVARYCLVLVACNGDRSQV
jgi:hypothetical protein